MPPRQTVIGLVQIGEVVWERRPSRQFHVVDGTPRQKPAPATAGASLAYLPHVPALLEAYVRRHAPAPDAFDFLLPLYRRTSVAAAAEHLAAADIAGFSTYVWNVRHSLAVARVLKARRPGPFVVFGGPQVPDAAESFLRAHPYVDAVCHGEGERTFLDLVTGHADGAWRDAASVSYLDAEGGFHANARRDRMRDLDEIPSPMLDGAYDRLMRAIPEQQWLATWETNRGCPFSCAFCDWGSATGSAVSRYGTDRLHREVTWLADRGIHHLFVCDANFGMLPRDVDLARHIADTYAARRSYVAISVQNTKNRTDRSEHIQRIFQRSGVVSFGASISLQSVDPDVLKAIQRDNISLEAFERLQQHYAREGLDTYSDLIIGLPGETYGSFTAGISRVIRGGQLNRIAFYECSVLPNAPMAHPDYRTTHGLETVPVPIVHAHEAIDARPHRGDGAEHLDIVVSTTAMPREDWVRARSVANLVELLFYNRLLHVPMTLLGAAGVDYRRMFEAFLHADPAAFSVTAGVCRAFAEHARAIQAGAPQYVAAPEWLGLWWPADQHALIGLARAGTLDDLYDEAVVLLSDVVRGTGVAVSDTLVDDAVRLNQAMFARPFQWTDEEVATSFAVLEAYESVLQGRPPDLSPRPARHLVRRTTTIWTSWDDWCEDLVRRVFLRRQYLYPAEVLAPPPVAAAAPAVTRDGTLQT